MLSSLKSILRDESGQTMTEYILLVVLVAITAAASFQLFRQALINYYDRLTFWGSLPIP